MSSTGPYSVASAGFRLVRCAPSDVSAPDLDPGQRSVVDHDAGPLLVVAGPGTGKTTTIVEAVVHRIAERGIDPERILVLTFSRKAAAELRERINARLARTTREPLARTFHSYAYGLLRREAAWCGEPAPRLLSGPEQDLMIRDLLRGDADGTGVRWPEALRPALLTRGFAQELRDLLMRCYERGVDPGTLERYARELRRDDWRSVARFMRQYDAVSALAEGGRAYDASELIRAVAGRFADPRDGLRDRERAAYEWVFVDEYQDSDPSQEELLRHLVSPGGNLVVVGDPNQSIYGFRGADPRCIRRFAEVFAAPRAPVGEVRLTVCRRCAPRILAASQAVADRLLGVPTHRALTALAGRSPGRVDVYIAASAAQEASLVAGSLRRAHLVDGVPWSRMAVLVRSTRRRLAVLRRAMLAAGVPVAVAGDEVPLAEQPGLRPLIDVLRIALLPESLDDDTAARLLTSSLGGLDALGLRRLRRGLRSRLPEVGADPAAGGSLAALLREPVLPVPLPDHIARPLQHLLDLLALARAAAAEPGQSAERLLWEVWSASGLPERWQRLSAEGGSRGVAADRDLDAAMALFAVAAHFADRMPKAGPHVFLDHVAGQQIPGDSLAARAPTVEAVRVVTAHGSKGLEWDLVVLAGAQEGEWPDLRMRGSLLGSELLVQRARSKGFAGPAGWPGADSATNDSATNDSAMTPTGQLDEERRLFYVACTRARERLVVTAVSDVDEGEQPSRFLADLSLADDDPVVIGGQRVDTGGPAEATLGSLRRALPVPVLMLRLREIASDHTESAPTRRRARRLAAELQDLTRSLDLTTIVGELRAVVSDDQAPPDQRGAAARELARLVAAGVPGAHPDQWFGLAPLSDERPLRDPGEGIPVSPSKVEQFLQCELRWLLEGAGGTRGDTAKQSVGTLVHGIAAMSADLNARDEQVLLAALDERWPELDIGGPWYSRKQRDLAAGMIKRLLAWLAVSPRRLVATEIAVRAELELPGRTGSAMITGQVDRLELDEAGRGYVVDLKTGSTRPGDAELPTHPQLGVYQLATELGAFNKVGITASGGASLLQLGKGAGADWRAQPQQGLSEADHPEWARALVTDVAIAMAGSAFRARENRYCQLCPVRTSCPLHDAGRQVVGE